MNNMGIGKRRYNNREESNAICYVTTFMNNWLRTLETSECGVTEGEGYVEIG